MTHPLVETGAVLLISGGSGAIGSEIAAQAAAGGARVVVHGSSADSTGAAVAKLKARVPTGDFTPLAVDLADAGGPARMVDGAAAIHGRLDAFIHCATARGAEGVTGPLSRTRPDNYARFLASGVGVLEEACFAALPHLAARRGAILAFASDSGLFAAPRQSLVAANMGAIMAFVRNLGLEAARDGVRVNCISPSFVADTPIFDQFAGAADGRADAAAKRARLGLPTPRDIAPMALLLTGPASTRITGQVISINGGMNA